MARRCRSVGRLSLSLGCFKGPGEAEHGSGSVLTARGVDYPQAPIRVSLAQMPPERLRERIEELLGLAACSVGVADVGEEDALQRA